MCSSHVVTSVGLQPWTLKSPLRVRGARGRKSPWRGSVSSQAFPGLSPALAMAPVPWLLEEDVPDVPGCDRLRGCGMGTEAPERTSCSSLTPVGNSHTECRELQVSSHVREAFPLPPSPSQQVCGCRAASQRGCPAVPSPRPREPFGAGKVRGAEPGWMSRPGRTRSLLPSGKKIRGLLKYHRKPSIILFPNLVFLLKNQTKPTEVTPWWTCR